jgi:hypothetical protein
MCVIELSDLMRCVVLCYRNVRHVLGSTVAVCVASRMELEDEDELVTKPWFFA